MAKGGATARKMVIALSALVATRPTFGSPARRSAWRARVVGVLLAPTASLAAARPGPAGVRRAFLARIYSDTAQARLRHGQ